MRRFLLLLLIVGCSWLAHANHCIVNIESWGEYDMDGRSFAIATMFEDVDESDLEYEQYVSQLASLLTFEGAHWAENRDSAEVLILLGYGVNDASARPYHSVSWAGYSGRLSSATISADAEYMNYVYLQAYTRGTVKPKMVWKTDMRSDGSWDHTTPVFPIMIYAARDYMGKPTRPILVNENDGNLSRLSWPEQMAFERYDSFVYQMVKQGVLANHKMLYSCHVKVGKESEQVAKREMKIDFVTLAAGRLLLHVRIPSSAVHLPGTIYLEMDGQRYYLNTSWSTKPVAPFGHLRYYVARFDIPEEIAQKGFPMSFSIGDDEGGHKALRWENVTIEP